MTTIISQYMHEDALLAVFSSSARVAVIRVFMLDPLRAYYQRQIEAATGLPIRAVQRELDRFTAIGLLYRRVEGNRTYYQVDMQFPLFPELRSMMTKAAPPDERLRGALALDESVRLVFLNRLENRVLVVTTSGRRPNWGEPGVFQMDVMSTDEFTRALAGNREVLEPFLSGGVDLLGRREDVIWRRIEAAGYQVEKDKGVP
jgi:hypothetical protein